MNSGQKDDTFVIKTFKKGDDSSVPAKKEEKVSNHEKREEKISQENKARKESFGSRNDKLRTTAKDDNPFVGIEKSSEKINRKSRIGENKGKQENVSVSDNKFSRVKKDEKFSRENKTRKEGFGARNEKLKTTTKDDNPFAGIEKSSEKIKKEREIINKDLKTGENKGRQENVSVPNNQFSGEKKDEKISQENFKEKKEENSFLKIEKKAKKGFEKTPPLDGNKEKERESIGLPDGGGYDDEDKDDLLNSYESNPFWLLQQFIWKIFRIVVPFLFLGLIIWFIWGDKSDTNKDKKEKIKIDKIEIEKEVEAIEEIISQKETTKKIFPAIPAKTGNETKNYPQTLLQESARWISNARYVGINLYEKYNQSTTNEERINYSAIIITKTQNLLSNVPRLTEQLQSKIIIVNDEYQLVRQQYHLIKNKFWKDIEKGAIDGLPNNIDSQGALLSRIGILQMQIEVLQRLQKNINNLANSLRSTKVPLALPVKRYVPKKTWING